ncbi:P-type Ca2+ transporter type 2C, partial [Phenoliferia sp. Uapishka_3]
MATPLPTIITTSAPDVTPPSSPRATPSGNSPITPPPTFTISTADSDEPPTLAPLDTSYYSPTSSSRTPSPSYGGGYSPSEGPPSPTGSSDPFVAKSSLGLRDNDDARDQELHSLGVSDAPSFGGTSDGGHFASKGHNRRPSNALSFASTIPDGATDEGLLPRLDREGGAKDATTREEVEEEEEEPRKWCGLIKRKKKAVEVAKVRPDPTPQEMAPFAVDLTPSSLYHLIDPKSYEHLEKLGGTPGLLSGLKTDAKKGLSEDGGDIPLSERVRVYGANRTPTRKGKSLLRLMWMAYQDKVLVRYIFFRLMDFASSRSSILTSQIILSIAAVVSLALGLYQDLGTPPTKYASTKCPDSTPIPNMCTEPQVDWVEGVAITIAIFIVVIVGSVNDYQKERQFQKLNAQKEERNVKVVRDGSERLMSVYDVVVGDVLYLEPGEIVPVDGVFLEGYNVRCDESGATGESDAVRKAPFEECDPKSHKVDSFLISGSKVIEGVGTYVATGVGESSFHGRLMMSLRGDAEETPLQLKLNALAELIAKLGSLAGLLLFAALMIRFFVELGTNPGRTANDKAQNFIQILIIAVTIVVVAVPEGLPLAVTLALAFATRRMTQQNLLVRVLGACETMANATVICTDKTGTLTQNQMSVVAGAIGVHLKFADRLAENASRTNANDDSDDFDDTEKDAPRPHRAGRTDFSCDMTDINSHISGSLRRLINDSVAINSTAFEGTDEHGKLGGFVGSKTETALLSFAKTQGWADYKQVREQSKVVQMIPFSSERKAMGVVVELPEGGFRLMLKGASEVLAKLSTRHVVVAENIQETSEEGAAHAIPTEEFTDETRSNICEIVSALHNFRLKANFLRALSARTIIFYANQSLRTIALCSRDFPTWPPVGAHKTDSGDVEWEDLARDLTLVAVTAIEDPLREGVSKAVATCLKAGVQVKMCTGDNVLTARSIAIQCGIFTAGGVIMEGPVFRNLSKSERDQIVPRLQVLARSSPEDKRVLVEHLKSMGEVVGVSGDGSNDAPALKTANVGFSMGIAGTEVAKEASDIILMDDNFASMVSAIMWGRCVNDSVKKFLQFQISVNITAVVITFISAVASSDESSVLTAVQLLWVNLIMDTFAALALATDPADPESLNRKPDRKTAPLITVQMWMMIIFQAIYQTIVALVLHFAGNQIFGFHSTDAGTIIDQKNELDTLVFNTFVFCQIFNQLNARRLDRGLNVFTGILKNYYFIAIFAIMVGGQIIIVEFGGSAFQVVRVGGRDWGVAIVLGFLSLPLAVLVRLLPPEPFERFMIRLRLYPDPNAPLPTSSPSAEERQWGEGIGKVIDNLNTFSQIRGGRLRSSSMVLKSRTKQMEQHDIHPSALMAMIPSLVAGSIGAGWRPTAGTLSDPAGSDPSKSSVQLFSGHTVVHPDTDATDPLSVRFNATTSPSRGGHSRQASRASTTGHSRSSSLAVPGAAPSLSPPSPTH